MPFNSGAMIALVVPDPENYAINPPTENSLAASDLHITLAYLGEASEISAPEREAILEACQVLADTSDAPESLFPASTGVFPPDPESPDADEDPKAAYYAAPAHPERFSALREDLMTHLSARGVSHFVSTKHPVFTPHVTLTYESMDTPPNLNLPTPVPVKFPELLVKFGEEVHTFTLRAEDAGPALPLTASVRHRISLLASSARYSEEYVTAIYLRQTHVTASAAQSRAQAALDATAVALGLEDMATPLTRINSLVARARMSASPEEKVYYASRALALASKTNPTSVKNARNLSALTASIQSLIADGNSSAARSARARAQLRDRYGRWIYMGGSIRFKISIAGTPGGGRWEHGVARGVDMATGQVQVELEDGSLVSVPANKVEQTKATLGEKINGIYRSFRPRTEGAQGEATPENERAKAERAAKVDAADNEAFPAIERLMQSTADVAAGGNPKGNHVITLMSNNADEIKRASLAGEETVDVTGSRAPFRDVTVPVSTSDAMAVINGLDARRILPEDYESLDDTEKARAYGAAQGRAIAALSGRFNDRDDAEASELRRAPSVRSEDIQNITEDDLTGAEPQSFSARELSALANDAMDKLNENVDGNGPMVSQRDQIGSAIAKANAQLNSGDITQDEYLNALDAVKEFAYAQGGAGTSDSDAFDAFSEDIDNIHAAAGGSDDIDRVKAMFNAIESDNLFAGNLDDESGLVSDFNDHMNEIREKIANGSYLREPSALADDLEDFKNHFNSDSQGEPISSQINSDISSKAAEDLDESIAALRGERTGEAYDSSSEEDPGLGTPDMPEYQATTPEVQESINEGSALYDVLWEEFPEGILEDDFPGSTDFFEPMGEFFSPDFEETPENFRQFRDKIDAFDPAVFSESQNFQQEFKEQKDKFVAALDSAADSLDGSTPDTSDTPDTPEFAFAEGAANIATGLRDILDDEDYSPSRDLRDAVNELSNIAVNVGLDVDSGAITPERGADVLDKARSDFMNLYGDDTLGSELNAEGIGEDLEDYLVNDYNDFTQRLRDAESAQSAQEVDNDSTDGSDSGAEEGVPEADGTGPGDSGEPADSVEDDREWASQVEDRELFDAFVEKMGGGPYAGFTPELVPPKTAEEAREDMREIISEAFLDDDALEKALDQFMENWTQGRATVRLTNDDLNVTIGVSRSAQQEFTEREIKHALDSMARPVATVRAGGDDTPINIGLIVNAESASPTAAAYYTPNLDHVTFIREHLALNGGYPNDMISPSFERFGLEHYITHELGHLVDFRSRNNGEGFMSLPYDHVDRALNDGESTAFFAEIFSEDGLLDALGGNNIYAATQPVEAYAEMYAYYHLMGGTDDPLRNEAWDRVSERYAEKYGWIRAAAAQPEQPEQPEQNELFDSPDDSLIDDLAPEISEDKRSTDEALRELRRRLEDADSTPEDVYDSVRDAQDTLNRYADEIEDALDDAEEGSDKESLLEGEKFRAESTSDALDDVLPDLDEASEEESAEPISDDTITQAINDLRALNNPLATAQADIFEAMRENGIPVTAEQIRQMRDMLDDVTNTSESTDDDRAMGTVTDRILDSIPDVDPDDDFNPAAEYREAIENAGDNENMREQIRREVESSIEISEVERQSLLDLLDGVNSEPMDEAPEAEEAEEAEEVDNFGVEDFDAWRDVISNFDPDAGDSVDELREEISEDPYITDEQREELIRQLNERADRAIEPEPEPEPQPEPEPEPQPTGPDEAGDAPSDTSDDVVADDVDDADQPIGSGQHTPLTPARRSAVLSAIELAERRNVPRAAEILTEALSRHEKGEIPDYKLTAALGNAAHMIKPYDRSGNFTDEDLRVLASIKEVQASLQRNMERSDNDPNLPELSWDNLAAQMERNEGGLLDDIEDDEIQDWMSRIQRMTVAGEEKRFELLPEVEEANRLIREAEQAFQDGDRERAQDLLRSAVDSFDEAINNRRGINVNDAFKRSLERRRRATEALSARMDSRAPRITQGGRNYYISGTYNRNTEEVFAVGGRGRDNSEVREARVGDAVMRTHGDNYGQRGVIVGFKGTRGIDRSPTVEILVYDENRRGGAGYRILVATMNSVKQIDESITNDSMSDDAIREMVADVEREGKPLGRHLQEEVSAAVRRNRDLNSADSGPVTPPEPLTPESVREENNSSAFDGAADSAPVRVASDDMINDWIAQGWGDRVQDMVRAFDTLPSANDLADTTIPLADRLALAKELVGVDNGTTFGTAGYTLTRGDAMETRLHRKFDGSQEYRVSANITDSRGKNIGLLTRNIEVHKDANGEVKIHIHNSFMKLFSEDDRGSGFAQAINGRMEAWAAANHTATSVGPLFTIEAALENGGYVWSKFGFRFESNEAVEEFITNLEDENTSPADSLVSKQIDELKKAYARGETILPVDIMMVGFQPGMTDKKGDVWLGKKILNGADWYGIKDIRPSTVETAARRSSEVERREAPAADSDVNNPAYRVNEYRDEEVDFVVDGLRNMDSNRTEAQRYRPREWAAINNLLMNGGSVAGLPSALRDKLREDIRNLLRDNHQGVGPVLYELNRAFFRHKYSDRPAPTDLGVGEPLRNLRVMTPNEARDSGIPDSRLFSMTSTRAGFFGQYYIEIPEEFEMEPNQNFGVNEDTAYIIHKETGERFLFKSDDHRRGEPVEGLENNADIEQAVNTLMREAGFVGVNYVAPFEGTTSTGSTRLPIIIQAMAGNHLGLDRPATTRAFSGALRPEDLEDPTQYIDLLALDLLIGHSDRHNKNSMIGQVDGRNILIPIDNTLINISDQYTRYSSLEKVEDWISQEFRLRQTHQTAAELRRRLGTVGFKNLMKRSLREYAEAFERSQGNYSAPEFTEVFRESLDMIENNIEDILNMLR